MDQIENHARDVPTSFLDIRPNAGASEQAVLGVAHLSEMARESLRALVQEQDDLWWKLKIQNCRAVERELE